MKISVNWLRRYVAINVPVEELCRRMVAVGFEVESVEYLGDTMQNVVVGRVERLSPHENSDHLVICSVDVGADAPLQIVTGAQNLFEGALVPTALHDSRLPNGAHIKRGKLRGVESNGMLCSGEELGLKEADYPGAEVHGILILRDDCAVGTDLREILGLDDTVIDFKITANRPDCQSVLGVAREVSVVLGQPFRPPVPTYRTVGGDVNDHIRVEVRNHDLCPRYMGRVVRNLRIAPSPDWLKHCLRAAGMRPINNIVDITNFVMLETGQPMHAFDLRDVAGAQIIVRNAIPGEPITTLDGKPHELNESMPVIAARDAPSCLAGIMGGLNSEIKPDTTDLFLESAKFRRDNIRRTSRALGVRTESSGRYERGTDICNVAYAMERAMQLIDELGAGDIIDGVIDRNEGLPQPRALNVPCARINALLGLEIPDETMAEILNRLSIETELRDGVLHCKVPSFRDDVEGSADLAEEVMRVYGYDHIVGAPMRGDVVRGKKLPEREKTDRVKARLTACGAYEIMTYSFIASRAVDTLRLPENDPRRDQIQLRNPLGDEYSVLRTQLATSMLGVLATNFSRKIPAVRFFEVSKRFLPRQLPATEQPDEAPTLSLGLYGDAEDFFTLKGLVEAVLALSGGTTTFERSDEPFLHPGRQARALLDGKSVAVFGEVHPQVLEDYGIETRAYLAEVDLAALFAVERPRTVYRPLPRFPAVVRDLALLCDRDLPVGALRDAIAKAAGKLCEDVALFDVYEGAQIPAGKKSVAFSVTLRAADATLTDAQVEQTVAAVVAALEATGAVLRQS